jgi:hypothetical protein
MFGQGLKIGCLLYGLEGTVLPFLGRGVWFDTYSIKNRLERLLDVQDV